ncbi:glycosyltransferase [Desulfovibrio sp. OttesenSCG-928-M14]|nr:glycosyltransferase [Desulfovibrio sp. OttesenSCG-928-M14]
MSVAIIIVTYNRVANLRVTIDACLAQQGELHIFVVDNASSDGTAEYLRGVAIREPRLTVLRLTENTGGAGGFSYGISKAYDEGYAWFWLMDDDVIPLQGALPTLLAHGRNAYCVYPAKECADGRLFAFEGKISRKTLWRRYVHKAQELEEKGWLPVNSGNFEGAFIRREVMDAIGLPDTRFFICWDDTLYGMQAAEHFPCIYIKDICMRKQFDKEQLHLFGKKFLSSTVFSRYHFFRNYWAVMSYLRKKGELSPFAYLLYALLLGKALLVTVVLDRNPQGALKVLKGALCGLRGEFSPY